MIVVIQCAGSKQPTAGRMKTADGKPVIFVAQPGLAQTDGSITFSHPDDVSGKGGTWRQWLVEYNRQKENPLGLLPAYQLYRNPIYRRLVDKLGSDNVYILSAGWGLIRADFLTPYYDITFSNVPAREKFKQRRPLDAFEDFTMLPSKERGSVTFFGTGRYLPLFCSLTAGMKGIRTVFYRSLKPPDAPGCTLRRFEGAVCTNWHYVCAGEFLDAGCQTESP